MVGEFRVAVIAGLSLAHVAADAIVGGRRRPAGRRGSGARLPGVTAQTLRREEVRRAVLAEDGHVRVVAGDALEPPLAQNEAPREEQAIDLGRQAEIVRRRLGEAERDHRGRDRLAGTPFLERGIDARDTLGRLRVAEMALEADLHAQRGGEPARVDDRGVPLSRRRLPASPPVDVETPRTVTAIILS